MIYLGFVETAYDSFWSEGFVVCSCTSGKISLVIHPDGVTRTRLSFGAPPIM